MIPHLNNQTEVNLNHLRMTAGHAKFGTMLQYMHLD
jgi:hypothetical protein